MENASMNMSTVLGIGGIIVSIAVGFGTYYLAERTGRRNRWQNAKDVVLRDLSKSLGEGNVPNPPVILATIRSVLRLQGASSLEAVTLDEVTDDLLRQITSDPFLDSERRIQLQDRVLEIKATHLRETEARVGETYLETSGLSLNRNSIGAIFGGITASFGVGVALSYLFNLVSATASSLNKSDLEIVGAAVSAILTLLVVVTFRLIARRRELAKKLIYYEVSDGRNQKGTPV